MEKHVVALWNMDKKYFYTRHNAGALVALEILRRGKGETETNLKKCFEKLVELNKSLNMYLGSTDWKGVVYNFYFPNTFMNLSGIETAKLIKKENIKSEELMVMFDDMNLPLGKTLKSVSVGASSHNGIKSIIENTKTNNFVRLRIGVGEKGQDGKIKRVEGEKMADFVLDELSQMEVAHLQSEAVNILKLI